MTYANLVHSRHYRAHWFQTFQTYFEFFLQLEIPIALKEKVTPETVYFLKSPIER